MKILHVIPTVAPCYGGPSEALRRMTAALAEQGVEVHVATTTGNGKLELDVPVGVPITEDGVVYYYFRRQAPKGWDFSWPLTRWLFSHIAEYELAHIHALFSYPSLAGCRAAYRCQVPYVLRPLGTLDTWPLRQGWWKKWPYLLLLEKPNLRRAAAIHATSEMERQELARLTFVPPAVVVPLGVPVGRGATAGGRKVGGTFTLLFMGRLHPIKGLPLLLEALARARASLDSVRLIVAGSGDPKFTPQLVRLCARLGLDRQVEFSGFVSGEQKQRLFEEADAFILPSYHESFGVSVAEAMAYALPVIVTDRVGLAQEIETAGAGVVAKCDVGSIGDAIARLAGNPGESAEMGRRGRALVQGQFTWEKAAMRLIDLYQDVLRASRKKGADWTPARVRRP